MRKTWGTLKDRCVPPDVRDADVEQIIQKARECHPGVTPHDVLAGRRDAIHAERDRKLEAARERRKLARQAESIRVAPPPEETLATLVTELIPNPPVLSLTAEG